MSITISSREFNQRASQILKLSEQEPVFIKKWGKVVSVLSSYQDYQQSQIKEPGFEEIFAAKSEKSDDVFLAEFEQELQQIRQNSDVRAVEFE